MSKKAGGKKGPSVPKSASVTNNVHHIKPSILQQEQRAMESVKKNEELVKKTQIFNKIDTQNSQLRSLEMTGSGMFRHKIIFSLLSGKALKINEMRPEDPIKPGIRDYEVNFLRFIDSITTGTALKINNTGTSIKFSPGMLLGGKVTHSCTTQRSIGYLIEACLILGPFCKEPLDITFTDCITNSDTDLSCDIIRAVSIRQLQHFGIGAYDLLGVKSEVPEIKVTKRGAPPLGGGEVKFTCPIVKTIKPCTLIDPGMIKRVRGLAYTTKCSSSFAQRMVSASRGVLHGYIGDIHIYTDTFTRKEGGDSPGYAIGLAAESTTGCVLSSQRTAITPAILAQMNPNTTADTTSIEDSLPGDVDLLTPEDVGRVSAKALLEEISYGGCVDGYHQLLFLCYMALGPEQQVSRVRFGTITPQAVYMLRLLKEFWNIEFQLQPDVKSNTVLVSCVGLGYQNMNKKMC